MKIYYRKKTSLYFGLAALILITIAIILLVIGIVRIEYTYIFLAIFLTFMGGLFSFISILEHRSTVSITNETIIIKYKTFSDIKYLNGFNRKGLEIKFSNIEKIDTDITIGTNNYPTNKIGFYLKDNTFLTVYFYHFGKKAEHEIINDITSKLMESQVKL